MDLLAAITLGLLGSMHCIGMCGPLVLAVPSAAHTRIGFIIERIVYNSGRAATYGIMGAVFGVVGKSILVNVQQDLSIVVGVLILLTVALPFGFRSQIEKYSPLKYAYGFVKRQFGVIIQKRGIAALFVLGMLNGLLPCGLVYTALVGAAAVADVWGSALFMIVFGFGTIPALVAVSLTGKLLSVKYRSILTKAIPVFSIILALILILRGMNLGIPMISPKVTTTTTQTETQTDVDCCE
ncbi:MAG: sulfite exporter TauE/SafE family protein [Bacteroidota bacterium]